ncbi:MAG: hypothetical protein RSA99_02425 [Oscillospiraceae bacterium]
MRTYKRKNTDIPTDVYTAMKSILSGYDRLKAQKIAVEQRGNPPPNGMPRGNDISNPTQDKALILSSINEKLYAIDQTYIEMQGAYSAKTYDEFNPIKAFWSYDYFNYMHKRKNCDDIGPTYRTWGNFKYRFAKSMAKKLRFY